MKPAADTHLMRQYLIYPDIEKNPSRLKFQCNDHSCFVLPRCYFILLLQPSVFLFLVIQQNFKIPGNLKKNFITLLLPKRDG